MCDPITLAAVSTGVGTAVSAAGSIMAGQQQSAAMKQQAALYDRQREIEGVRSSFQSQRVRENLGRVIGQNRAAAAQRGLSEGGSVVDVMDDSAREAAMDLEAIRFGSQAEQGNLQFQADSARARAGSARTAGYMNAFGTVAKGATSMFTTLSSPYAKAGGGTIS